MIPSGLAEIRPRSERSPSHFYLVRGNLEKIKPGQSVPAVVLTFLPSAKRGSPAQL